MGIDMNNMKIEINEQQPLDDVVRELEQLGFILCGSILKYNGYIVTTNKLYTWCSIGLIDVFWSKNKPTTLAELRSMNVEQLKEM